MLGLWLEGFQNQQVQRALDEVNWFDGLLPMMTDNSLAMLVSIIKGRRNRVLQVPRVPRGLVARVFRCYGRTAAVSIASAASASRLRCS